MIRTIYILDENFGINDNIEYNEEIEKYKFIGMPLIDSQGKLLIYNIFLRQAYLKHAVMLVYLPYFWYKGELLSINTITKKIHKVEDVKVYKIIEVVIEDKRENIEDLLDDLENALLEENYAVALEILEDIREEVKREEKKDF